MKLRKTISFVLVIIVLSFALLATVYADHSNDDFNGWTIYGLLPWQWDEAGCHSDFYCDVQLHHATAVADGTPYQSVRVTADAGYRAVAETPLVTDPVTHAYYGHD